jgi:hypothetical protein
MASAAGVASGARFCYLMINLLPNQKINTYIGESGHPFQSVIDHNEGRARASKSTKSAAPHWKLEMIVGEFADQPSAVTFANSWRANSRGIVSRRKRGHALAKLHGKTRYDRQHLPEEEDDEDEAAAAAAPPPPPADEEVPPLVLAVASGKHARNPADRASIGYRPPTESGPPRKRKRPSTPKTHE